MRISSGSIKYVFLVGAITSALVFWAFSASLMNKVPTDSSVIAVYPSGNTVRENLLRISVRFDTPPGQTSPPKVQLLRESGEEIEDAFDEQLMWSADGTILTVLLGPGRVKSGLDAHEKLGRALTTGEMVSLAVGGQIVKRWQTTGASEKKLQPESWAFEMPPLSSRKPFVIEFDEPIDAMDAGFIAIVGANGNRIEGEAILDEGEMKWRFVPALLSWTPGDYQVIVNPHLEDSCGNSVVSAFESSRDATGEKSAGIRINFHIS